MTTQSTTPRLRHLPALDGLRGVAVAAVLLFHGQASWLPGGHLGVSVFFTLSGFLITAKLVLEHRSEGRISLGGFWARRARRLVPAALLALGVIAAVITLLESPPSGLVGDAVSSVTWTANWHFVLESQTYADAFSAPTPFQHFWSLAVEEQFYLLFPLLAVAMLGGGGASLRRGRLAAVLVVLVGLSTFQAARLHDAGDAIGRAYYGTDARVAEILVGALLALALVGPTGVRRLGRTARRAVGVLGIAGAVGVGTAFASLGDHDPRLYDGGFLVVALCTAAVLAAATQPTSLLARVLSNRPAVALGTISYGVYLFHWPVFVLVSEQHPDLAPAPALAWKVAITLALAVPSYLLVEAPIRHGRFPTSIGLVGWANGTVAAVTVVALATGQLAWPAPEAGTDAEVEVAGTSASARPATPDGAPGDRLTQPSGNGPVAADGATPAPDPGGSGQQPQTTSPPTTEPAPSGPEAFAGDPEEAEVPLVPDAPADALRVAVVGDSIGINLGRGLAIWAGERDDVVVYNLALPACPISRDGERRYGDGTPFTISRVCGWWSDTSSERSDALRRFAPHVVVVQDGINEIFDRRIPSWDDYRRPGDPLFDQWLRGEYEAAVDEWYIGTGARTVVTNTPCADFDRYRRFREIGDADVRVQQVNVTHEVLTNVVVADLFARVCPGARYSDEVEGVEDGRPDGFHFSDEAAAALARNWLGPIVLDAAAGDPPDPDPDADLLPAD